MSSETVLQAENISKLYRLGVIGSRTVSEDITRWWYRIRGKDDPFLKIGDEKEEIKNSKTELLWALKDVNFEIRQGEVLGIIGKNGAGKSTLLKILSQITQPTTGEIRIKGRIASLLEVGTGFHPDLTGRENVFMNGTILGMKKWEIKNKFDEIVEFSGVEKFIDTPVKRYSSGMYVRLAFSVAAHLESEILIIDEVLAVGDAEFQRKCLGKMEDVSKRNGRTVLFVSHNMKAVQNLCEKSLLLSNGMVEDFDSTENVIAKYLPVRKEETILLSEIKQRKGNGLLRFENGKIKDFNLNTENSVQTFSDMQFELQFSFQNAEEINNARIDIGINNNMGDRVAWLSSDTVGYKLDITKRVVRFIVNKTPLSPGEYNCNLYCEINNEVADWLTNVLKFQVIDKDYYGTGKKVPSNQGNMLLDYSIRE